MGGNIEEESAGWSTPLSIDSMLEMVVIGNDCGIGEGKEGARCVVHI